MVVQHNMQAMNANRMLGVTTSSQSKATEKLSSGYRINRAADDAAGLTISEKMRKQIRGLDQASTNAQDGVSAVQTAEGALTEVHSMLQRMNELATQASNGTNSQSDRDAIQAEIDQLTTEIDRVAETTKFNETYLLKGNTAGKASDVKVAAHDAGIEGKLTDNGDGTSTFKLNKALENGSKVTIAGKEYTIGVTKQDADFVSKTTATGYTNTNFAAGDSVKVGDTTTTFVAEATLGDLTAAGLKAADTFIDAEGNSWTIVADTATPADGEIKLGQVSSKLTEGAKVTKLNGSAVDIDVITAHGSNEVSLVNKTAVDAVVDTLDEGDTVTKSGKTTTVYDESAASAAGVAAAGVDSFVDVSKSIQELAAGKEVKINDEDPLTVATKTDAAKGEYTREDIIAMIKEGDRVKVDTGTVNYVYGVEDAAPEGTITKESAYRMISDELTKASSIGADTGKGAKAVSNGDGSFTITQGTVSVKDGLSFNLHVGADADMTNKITVNIDSMSAAGLGIKGLNVSDDTGMAATYAIDAIADAISKVSSQRSALGAVQNRLEHTIANVDNVVENTTSAESRIRDTDMAEMMVEYSKNNILAQAGQSMLAQANQATQGVLSLLG